LSRASEIPLVHTFYESYKLWHQLVLKFPKSERYTLGQTCGNGLLQLLELVLEASSVKDLKRKYVLLEHTSAKLDAAKLLVRLAHDCDCLQNNRYMEMQSFLQEAGKMLGGWKKSIG